MSKIKLKKQKKPAIYSLTIFAAFTIMLIFAGTALFADAPDMDGHYITDLMGLFSDSQIDRLEGMAERILDKYDCEARVIIVDSLDGISPAQTNNMYYHNYGLGYGPDKSCALLLISVVDRETDLAYWGFADYALTEYGAATLMDKYIMPQLSRNQYYEASEAFLENVAGFFDMAKDGAPFDESNDPELQRKALLSKLGGSAVISLLIALVVCFMWKAQMKTAKIARTAGHYIPEGGFNLTRRQDMFLYRTVTRTKIETSSGGGSGSRPGASRSGGGGHTSRKF